VPRAKNAPKHLIIRFTRQNWILIYHASCSKEHFGRNQLLPCSISLSLQYAGETNNLHVSTVAWPPQTAFQRASPYPTFRSQDFGSYRLYSNSNRIFSASLRVATARGKKFSRSVNAASRGQGPSRIALQLMMDINLCFHCAFGVYCYYQILVQMLDSLDRVSRRVAEGL